MEAKKLIEILEHDITKTAVNFFHTDDDHDEREALISALRETIAETVYECRDNPDLQL